MAIELFSQFHFRLFIANTINIVLFFFSPSVFFGLYNVLRFMGLQRVGHDWVTELNWQDYLMAVIFKKITYLIRSKTSTLHSMFPES